MKILSPVGNFDSLKAAVFNGADEVYLGINDFNARNNIDGFTLDTLEQATSFAHIFGVKVNLAINILFADSELLSAANTLIQAYNIGVDSFIIQDLGLASIIHEKYPDIELHASTQMGIHNLEGVQNILKYGFKRVVLSRETPIDEIKRIRENTSIEIEYFAQGALCVSFSGNCYLSSYLYNASGNRGKCKQLCRLPYSFHHGNKFIANGFLLSAKDFNMINQLQKLADAGVDVIKIEGRARRPYYVATTTNQYYNAINGNNYNEKELELAFNREFTPGYFSGNSNIISKYNNHIGIKVGKILKVNYGKKFNEIYFSSNTNISPKSTLKIFNAGKEQTTITAYDLKKINGMFCFTTTQKVEPKGDIHLIIDHQKETEALNNSKKRKIDICINLKKNCQIQATLTLNNKKETIRGDILQKAIKQPLTKEELVQTFKKHELFDAHLSFEEFDNVFLTKQKLNEFRRNVFLAIETMLNAPFKRNLKHLTSIKKHKINYIENFEIIKSTNNTVNKNIAIFDPEKYEIKDVSMFVKICESKNIRPYLNLPNFALEDDIKQIKKIIEETKIGIVANNYYALDLSSDIIIGAGLNVFNSTTALVLNHPALTAELDSKARINFPYMTLRHCPMKEHLGANCAKCPYKNGFFYKMDNGKIFNLERKKISSCTFYLTD